MSDIAVTSSDLAEAGEHPEPRHHHPNLSDREIVVLLTWIQCESKSQVCAALHIAPGTVNTHLARIRGKYAAAGRPAPTKAALVARALQDGLIRIDEL